MAKSGCGINSGMPNSTTELLVMLTDAMLALQGIKPNEASDLDVIDAAVCVVSVMKNQE